MWPWARLAFVLAQGPSAKAMRRCVTLGDGPLLCHKCPCLGGASLGALAASLWDVSHSMVAFCNGQATPCHAIKSWRLRPTTASDLLVLWVTVPSTRHIIPMPFFATGVSGLACWVLRPPSLVLACISFRVAGRATPAPGSAPRSHHVPTGLHDETVL